MGNETIYWDGLILFVNKYMNLFPWQLTSASFSLKLNKYNSLQLLDVK